MSSSPKPDKPTGPGNDAHTEAIPADSSDTEYPLSPSQSTSGSFSSGTDASASNPTSAMPAYDSRAAGIDNSAGASSTAYSTVPGEETRYDAYRQQPLPYSNDVDSSATSVDDSSLVAKRGTTDLGLFLLRATLGVLLAAHGAQKLFGVLDGPGIDNFASYLANLGYSYEMPLAVITGLIEFLGGILLIIGIATPAVVAALLGVMVSALLTKLPLSNSQPLLTSAESTGLELEIVYIAGLVALLFAGPGRWSADRNRRWSHRPRFSGWSWLIVTAAAVVLTWIFLNGGNPLEA